MKTSIESEKVISIEFTDSEHRDLVTVSEKHSISIIDIVQEQILEAIRKGLETEMSIESKKCFNETPWCDRGNPNCCIGCGGGKSDGMK